VVKSIVLLATLASLCAAADTSLAIVHPVFSQSEDGPPVATDYEFIPGEYVYFSCQVAGYRRVDKKDDFGKQDISLKFHVEVRDGQGVLLQPAQDGKIQSTLTSEDKDWQPKLREKVEVPPLADSGEYAVLVKLSDDLASTAAEVRAVFHIKGRDVTPSDILSVRNFRFLRGEDDQNPLTTAAYRPGDAVWARFDMTGYKFGDKNLVDIEYGLSVLREDGSTAYTQPEAATQRVQTFYPQRYQPGVLNLNLAKDQTLGRYTIVLTVRDNIGKQNFETRETFSVE